MSEVPLQPLGVDRTCLSAFELFPQHVSGRMSKLVSEHLCLNVVEILMAAVGAG